MTNDTKSALASNWYLIVGVVLFLAVGAVLGLRSAEEDAGSGKAAPERTLSSSDDAGNWDTSDEVWAQDDNRVEKANTAIDEFLARIDDDPGNPANAELLARIANVYFGELKDADNAILYYEQVVDEYPENTSLLADVFPRLADCYLMVDEKSMARQTYRRMMDIFPEDTYPYKYARENYDRI